MHKAYPRLLVPNKITSNYGYPLYRRRTTEDSGKTAIIKKHNGTNIEVDNQWVVPYSPLLSQTFNAHINIEYCNSVKVIKYICKYVNKDSDVVVFGLQSEISDIDEIVQVPGPTSFEHLRSLNGTIHETYRSTC